MLSGEARRGITGALVIALGLMTASPSNAAVDYDALLLWSAVPDAAGYRVYMKRNGGSYDAPVDIGRRAPDVDGIVSFELSALELANTTHFGVTSYDDSGTESDMSNEIALDRATIVAGSESDPDPTDPPASADDQNRHSVQVPIDGWARASGRGSFDVVGNALVTHPDPGSKPLEVRYPASGSLGSTLPEVEFRLRGASRAEFSTMVRVAGGGWRRIYYQLAEGPIRVRGKRAYVPIGADTSLRLVRRDVADDVTRIFGADFLHIERVAVHGAVELRRVTLRERGIGALPLERVVTVPIADWSPTQADAYGPVADEHTGAVAVASDGTRRMTFPNRGRGQLFAPFERLAVLVHDPSAEFSVHVQIETSHKRRRWLSFGSDHRDALPLQLRSNPGSPYQTAHLDLASSLAGVAATEDLKGIRHVRFSGGFQVTGLRLLEPMN